MSNGARAIEQRIIETIDGLGLSAAAVERDTSLDELGIDLPDMVEIVDVVQREFGICVTTDQLDASTTVGELVDAALIGPTAPEETT